MESFQQELPEIFMHSLGLGLDVLQATTGRINIRKEGKDPPGDKNGPPPSLLSSTRRMQADVCIHG